MNAFFQSALYDIPIGATPWLSGSIKATLVNASYTFNASHASLTDLGSTVLAGVTAQTLAGKTVSSGGVVAANSVTFSGVTSGQTMKALVLYIDLGGGVTRLIGYYDSGPGFPLTTTGADITIDFNGTPGNGTVYSAA